MIVASPVLIALISPVSALTLTFVDDEGNVLSDYYKIQTDTGNYLTGILGCLRLDDLKEFYVDEFDL